MGYHKHSHANTMFSLYPMKLWGQIHKHHLWAQTNLYTEIEIDSDVICNDPHLTM